ncbi:Error-prone repair protein UmuD [Vibrio owensii]|nr:Error-prone repair protein UmuD [Vibrio owensii]CAH1592006.1 Error-prone repair protein UmuD [Vibrio owensii]
MITLLFFLLLFIRKTYLKPKNQSGVLCLLGNSLISFTVNSHSLTPKEMNSIYCPGGLDEQDIETVSCIDERSRACQFASSR